MGKVIAVSNQKGGVGKTTLCMNVGGILSELKKKTLLIDTDGQGNLTDTFVRSVKNPKYTVYDLFTNEKAKITDIIFETEFPYLHIIPSLAYTNTLESKSENDCDINFVFNGKIEEIKDQYEYIIIDCPPSLSNSTLLVLTAADFVIIPIEMQMWSARGSNRIKEAVENIREKLNPKLEFLGYVISKFDTRRKIEREYYKLLISTFGDEVFEVVLKVSVKYPECTVIKKPINYYLPHSEQTDIFKRLTEKIIERINEKSL